MIIIYKCINIDILFFINPSLHQIKEDGYLEEVLFCKLLIAFERTRIRISKNIEQSIIDRNDIYKYESTI